MRLYPPVLTAAAAGAMVALDRWAPWDRWWPHTWAGAVPALLGLALVLWAALLMRRRGTTLHPYSQASALVVTGPFRISRNPIYLGFGLVLAGLAVGLGSVSPWPVLALWGVLMDRLFARREEDMLARTFGADFAAYAQRVRRWL
ncbi:MAG TPA: isoprenylcysteine carboxylmethyltransferase family protein [Magnetospirillum sp.]|nr:isoprenylcysteine carboxylmethyltransferase family protein [Magnetospirillum sp.]